MENLINNFQDTSSQDYYLILLSFFLCIVSSITLKYIYNIKSISLTGKYHVGSIIPLLSLTTFLVISVVKSSLALSLGLVGALSVIRFRTPIKEPEELVYLFLAIAIGLGFGAGQIFLTVLCFSIIIICILFLFNRNVKLKTNDYNIIFSWSTSEIKVANLINVLKEITLDIDLIKFENENSDKYILYLKIAIQDFEQIQKIEDKFSKYSKDLSFSFYESKILS